MEITTAISINSWDIIKLALSAGVVTALINQGINWFKEWKKEKKLIERLSQYSALRITIELETFAISCADVISDIDMYYDSAGHAGRKHTIIPILAEYSDDVDWKSLDICLCTRIFTLRNEIMLSQGAIDFWYEIDDECVPTTCREQTGKCGYRAWQLANELRNFYKLLQFDPKQLSWDIESILKKHHDQAINRIKEEI